MRVRWFLDSIHRFSWWSCSLLIIGYLLTLEDIVQSLLDMCVYHIFFLITPNTLTHTHTIQSIEFTYYHNRFPEQAITQKHVKYDPLINAIRNKGWKTKPLITITAWVRGAIHEQSINKLVDLNIPKTNIKNLVKNIHQNAIKYLAYLVLNKRKLDNKQTTIAPPWNGNKISTFN